MYFCIKDHNAAEDISELSARANLPYGFCLRACVRRFCTIKTRELQRFGVIVHVGSSSGGSVFGFCSRVGVKFFPLRSLVSKVLFN